MGKYTNLNKIINSVFASPQWVSENIVTYPSNMSIPTGITAAIRVNIVAARGSLVSFPKSVAGQVIIDIFVPSGDGPKQVNTISDTLDKYLSGKTLTDAGSVQLMESTLVDLGDDDANKSLRRFKYSISFNYYGV